MSTKQRGASLNQRTRGVQTLQAASMIKVLQLYKSKRSCWPRLPPNSKYSVHTSTWNGFRVHVVAGARITLGQSVVRVLLLFTFFLLFLFIIRFGTIRQNGPPRSHQASPRTIVSSPGTYSFSFVVFLIFNKYRLSLLLLLSCFAHQIAKCKQTNTLPPPPSEQHAGCQNMDAKTVKKSARNLLCNQ